VVSGEESLHITVSTCRQKANAYIEPDTQRRVVLINALLFNNLSGVPASNPAHNSHTGCSRDHVLSGFELGVIDRGVSVPMRYFAIS